MTKKRTLILFTVALFAIVFVCISAGCINNSSDTDLSNTLVYAGESEDTINPILNSHNELPDLIFSGLMKYDGDGTPITDLAESYTFDKDNLVYTFTLKKGVTWHDGVPFTAEDVVFTYETLTKDESLSASITSNYQDIESVTAPDNYTVVFKMSKYNAAMLGYFTMGIIPEHLLKGQDINTCSFNQNPVGTGRYKFVEWDTAGGMIVLERNTAYYDKIPNIERIIYKTVSVESTKATMLLTGEADLAWLNANYAATFRNNSEYKNIDFTSADYRGVSMDCSSDFWQKNSDSIGVLNYAIDKQKVVDSVLDGRGEPAYSPIQLNSYGGNTEADIYSYDLDKFAAEMAKLGWVKGSDGIYERDGQKFHFTIQVRSYEEERVDIANLVSQMLKDAGVDMEIVLVSKFDWHAGYDGFLAGYATQFDPDMIYVEFVTGASDNTMHYSNAEVDALLEAARHEENNTERKALYGDFEVAYAKSPGILLIAYLDANYVSIAGLDGLDTTRLLGHHAVGVMWNVEYWTLSK
ncbi:MAG: ABC transporter substrate-binding protein [Candidatus Paceibacterota bacterium]